MAEANTGEHPAIGNGRALMTLALTLAKITSVVIGILVIVGGLIAAGFAAYYGLQTRDTAKVEHAKMAESSKEKRINIRKEAKEERKILKDDILTIVNKQQKENREDMKEIRGIIRTVLYEVRKGNE